MIRKFGERKQLKTAIANYGNLLIGEGKPAQAISYQEEVKAISIAIEVDISLGKAINNLANAHRLAGNTARAIAGFEEAIVHNKKIGNYSSIVHNYAGLRQCYQAILTRTYYLNHLLEGHLDRVAFLFLYEILSRPPTRRY